MSSKETLLAHVNKFNKEDEHVEILKERNILATRGLHPMK